MPRNPSSDRAKKIRLQGLIYFILQGEDLWHKLTREEFERLAWDGKTFVKVGRTVDIRKRFESLQCGNPMKLHLLGAVEGGPDIESAFHKWLHPYRHERGEWFQYSFRVAQYINSLNLYVMEGNCNRLTGPDEMLMGCECVWQMEDLIYHIDREASDEDRKSRDI